MRWTFGLFLLLAGVCSAQTYNPECNPDDWFRCNDGTCVTNLWRCDGEPDCTDGSDERGCEAKATGTEDLTKEATTAKTSAFHQCKNDTEFMCNKTVLCLPLAWVCDGVDDCGDGSDESVGMCSSFKSRHHCPDEMFFCNDTLKSCIPDRWKCDNKTDCPNGYDEDSTICHTSSPLATSTPFCDNGYTCKNTTNNPKCLAWSQVCDNKIDCPGNDDEGSNCGKSCDDSLSCNKPNMFCQGHPDQKGFCMCTEGYKMLNGTCVDIDECQLLPPVCSQKCENVPGKWYCNCDNGYELHKTQGCSYDKQYKPATLLFSGGREIRRMEITAEMLNTRYSLITNDTGLVRQAVGVGYDVVDNRVFWTDVSRKVLTSSTLAGSLIKNWNHTISKPEFLAVDSIGRNIYYSDSKKPAIGVCTLEGHYCQPVIEQGLTNPRGVAVYPPRGLLAYSNWDDNVTHAHIGLAGMDGSDIRILVNTSIKWPNGVAFDMPSNRLFWGEAWFDLLESIRLDGTGRHSVKPAKNFMSLHPFSVAVFEDTIFWSDHSLKEVQSCHKFTGDDHQVIVKSPKLDIYGIHIIHELLEPRLSSSACRYKMCSHMCLLKKGATDAVCRCPPEYYLKHKDGHECVFNESSSSLKTISEAVYEFNRMVPSYVTVTSTKSPPPSSSTKATTSASLKSSTSSINAKGSIKPTTSNESAESTPGPSNDLQVVVMGVTKDKTTSVIVGVVFAIVAFVCIATLIYCCLLRKRRSAKYLNTHRASQVVFKNPSFGLGNSLKDGEYTKVDEELLSVEVMGGGGEVASTSSSSSKLAHGVSGDLYNYSVCSDSQKSENMEIMADINFLDENDHTKLIHED